MQNYPASARYLSVHLNHKTEASVCLYAFVWLATATYVCYCHSQQNVYIKFSFTVFSDTQSGLSFLLILSEMDSKTIQKPGLVITD